MTGELILLLTIFALAIFVGFAGYEVTWVTTLLGTLAIVFATINVVGGFAVTHRMLSMFKRR